MEGGTSTTISEGSRRKSLNDGFEGRPQGVMAVVGEGEGIICQGYKDLD